MTKKEISEIRKQFQKGDNSLTRVCACYVHGEDKEVDTFMAAFQSLPEDDADKYIDIFKKTLSGSLNKNLFGVPFGREEGGVSSQVHEALDVLVKAGLDDEEALGTLYGAITQYYAKAENYVILLVHNRYDVPGKATDGTSMEDASDEMFSYLSCAICPVSLSKPGLSYQGANGFSSLERDWVAGMPEAAFLYPSFNDRTADANEALYYSASAKDLQVDFAFALFGSPLPLPAPVQKQAFASLLEEVFEGAVEYSTACGIKDCLDEAVLEAEDCPERCSGMFGQRQVKKLIEEAAGTEVDDGAYQGAAGAVEWSRGGLCAGNLTDIKTFEIQAPGVTVRVEEGMGARPEVKKVDGRNCIVIPLEGDMTVNGILAKA